MSPPAARPHPAPPPDVSAPRRRRGGRARSLLVFALACAVSPLADAQGSLLHEFIAPDPAEDVSLATTTLDGGLPAAIQTPSGLATAPDPQRPPSTQQQVYSNVGSDAGPEASYEPDRDTRRPNVERYDDPFSPATAPFKRLQAYDAVRADYSLVVRDRSLKTVTAGATVAAGDESFYGDIAVDLVPNEPVRIPTVGPDTRLVRMHVNPDTPVTVLRDGADNWFVRGTKSARVRLVVQLAIARATFGSEFADVDWSKLERHRAPQEGAHEAAFRQVAQAIGISTAMRPRDVVQRMVEYFRSFAPSDDPPKGHGDIYLDLALSRKGVCRHRAFAFLVTALHIGIPSRMVVNEAHAWVEVFDGSLWHRVDLGGAALNMDQEIDPSRPPYVPPPDPYSWPEQRDSGQDLADRTRAEQAQQGPAGPAGSGGNPAAPPPPSPPAPTPASDPNERAAERTEVVVTALDKDIRRGFPLHLQGQVSSNGAPCAHVRVDVILRGTSAPQGVTVGSLSTDERGRYDDAVVIPREVALGEYDLVVATPGDARCKPGRTDTAAP
ncbi:transglutaminase-like domain-containing protein [Sorangium sp. So ce1097]|uniref:transglutaminase-like domain-containing protein n=1 Tax=Sorangium sp. So ce1097 TaxID=3133330 RepID=UPI003F60B7F9